MSSTRTVSGLRAVGTGPSHGTGKNHDDSPPLRSLHTGRRPAAAAIRLAAVALALMSLSPAQSALAQESRSGTSNPTVVLVHGDWADASSWSKVVARLHYDGYAVAAVANPLRSLSGDAAYAR